MREAAIPGIEGRTYKPIGGGLFICNQTGEKVKCPAKHRKRYFSAKLAEINKRKRQEELAKQKKPENQTVIRRHYCYYL